MWKQFNAKMHGEEEEQFNADELHVTFPQTAFLLVDATPVVEVPLHRSVHLAFPPPTVGISIHCHILLTTFF
ncbi:hypothetical protein DMN91_006150 [Ooceraea biroi]|uniref:Uncharacterized protein n=1 Tax=Ooceraea biroi TaxID=2015173 RepID=A0A3L8DMW4_OOCBI|nr:hypothetical protein DMN91_006150 [Ooceraea biroi]